MKHSVSRSLGAGILLAVALLGGSWVQAAPAHDGDQSTSVKKAKKAKGGSAGQVRFLPGSEETTRDRSNRLRRECRGRVNAGACAGYTY